MLVEPIDPAAPEAGVTVRGDPDHPANFGRLCSKGSALAETLIDDGRLLYPQVSGRRVEWPVAIDHVAQGFARIIAEHGPDAVAFYVSGQLLTEDYYVANKLMKGAIGSANIDTNSRLCMASAVVGHKRAFGGDIVPCRYEDLEQAELIVLVGSNLAWCHPILYQRIIATRARCAKQTLVVIDPRRTASCQDADLHLPIRPGTDTLLFNGLLSYLASNGKLDLPYVDDHTEGFTDALTAARNSAPDPATVASGCGLNEREVTAFYRLFAERNKAVTLFSQGVNQSTFGTDKANAIINVHLATGRIGHDGCGPFSITGQPNAMGGREVGGLANQLAAHMDFDPDSVDRVRRFWGSDTIASAPGLKAVDLFDAVKSGEIKAIWIMGTNPAVSMPDAAAVGEALHQCELVVVSDVLHRTDTIEYADVLLPARGWGEKSGTVTNSERTISRQRAFKDSPGESKPDWWIITEVGRAMGHTKLFPYVNAADIFREHASLSGFENDGQRAFDISSLESLTDHGYDALAPSTWPLPSQGVSSQILRNGRYYTPSRRARFIPIGHGGVARSTCDRFPYVLNTGRIRDQWHTMTRTALAPRLFDHQPEPRLQMHPLDLRRQGLVDGQLAQIATTLGTTLLRVQSNREVQPGELFVPMHWSRQFCSAGAVDALVTADTDPHSGQPELKHTPAAVVPLAVEYYCVLLRHQPLSNDELRSVADYWAYAPGGHCHIYHLVLRQKPANFQQWARRYVPNNSQWLAHSAGNTHRFVGLIDNRLAGVLYCSTTPLTDHVAWLRRLFLLESLEPKDRQSVLLGHPPFGSGGPVVCSCFAVGRNTIVQAVADQQLTSAEDIGRALKAGTNCGSCLPEIKQLIDIARREA